MSKRDWSPKAKQTIGQKPNWKLIANLGDLHYLDFGGYFVYVDRAGLYHEKAELLTVDREDDEDSTYTVHRFPLERLKLVGGYLVPLNYAPDWPHELSRYDAWFHDDLGRVADSIGAEKAGLERAFTSSDPIERAHAYRAIGDYHGWDNLDSYPLEQLTREQAERRYAS